MRRAELCPLYPPKADIAERECHVRFVPKADSCTAYWCGERPARELLIAGGLSLSEIAFQVGFCDRSHLARHFRRRYGVVPRERERTVMPSNNDLRASMPGRQSGMRTSQKFVPM